MELQVQDQLNLSGRYNDFQEFFVIVVPVCQEAHDLCPGFQALQRQCDLFAFQFTVGIVGDLDSTLSVLCGSACIEVLTVCGGKYLIFQLVQLIKLPQGIIRLLDLLAERLEQAVPKGVGTSVVIHKHIHGCLLRR